MKLDLYATEHEQGWLLHVSLDMRVDSLWWTATHKRGYPCQSLWHIVSGLPAGWAFACMRHFNQVLPQSTQSPWLESESERPLYLEEKATNSASFIIEQVRQWLSEYMNARHISEAYSTDDLRSNEADLLHSSLNTHSASTLTVAELVIPCCLWTNEQGWTGSGKYMLCTYDRAQLAGDLQQSDNKKELICGAIALTGLLNGRSLLLPELHHLLDEKHSAYSSSWRSCLQLAYLQKHIRLLDSVCSYSHASASGSLSATSHWLQVMRSSHYSASSSAACRRCGSVKIRYTACAGCGSPECGYCEECLMMGRSRECGILIQSVRPPIDIRTRERSEQKSQHVTERSRSTLLASIRPHLGIASVMRPSRPPINRTNNMHSKESNPLNLTTNPNDLQTRWGLSHAQAHATRQALAFLDRQVAAEPEELSQRSWMQLGREILYKVKRLLHTEHIDQHQSPSELLSKIKEADDLQQSAILNGLQQMNQLPRSRRFLLWAVTGAGKTEMTFPLIDRMLSNNQNVLIATPRRDVVLELAPRIRQAFPQHKVVALYGGSEEQGQQGAITIATTHQLLRYHAAFDLVIIDEIDAFPYDGNSMLAYGAYFACRPNGRFVYLSATPSEELRKAIRQGRLEHVKVPVRFHGHPLPVPERILATSFLSWQRSGRLPSELLQKLQYSVDRGAQIFWFMPRIAWIEPMVDLLQQHFPMLSIAGTSSVDDQREHKVVQFRQHHIRILVTTTILERGVTVPGSDVYIIDAHDRMYNTAALIQMAGRAGRSKQDPAGKVIFTAMEYSRTQKQAIAQIRAMNRIAHKQNYLFVSTDRK